MAWHPAPPRAPPCPSSTESVLRATRAALSDFPYPKIFPVHVPDAALVRHLQVREVVAVLADERARIRIRGDLIDGRDHRVHLARVVDVAALRAVADEHARRVDD